MAILKNMWLRGGRQKVAGAVLYTLKGQTIQREQAASVANPRTSAQMEQRLRMANLVSLYRVNLPWMKRGAFESKKQTWSDYNAFVSANSKISPVFLTKGETEQGAAVVAPYVVTKGSLPSVTVISDETNEQFISDLYVGDLVINGTTTAAQLSAALRENNNNLQEGDQLSFILNFQGTTTESVPFITARYYEFIIDSNDNRTLSSLGLEGVIVADTWNQQQCMCLVNEGNVAGGTIIVSRTNSNGIKVSTQNLVLNQDAVLYLANYTNDAALQRAARSYGENEANFLSAGYSGKGSNVAVNISNSIISVGGVPVGGAAPDFNEGTLAIVLSSPATEVANPRVRFRYLQDANYLFGTAPSQDISLTASVSGTQISIQVEGEYNNAQISWVEIDVDGQTLRATMTLSASGSGDPGDVEP